MNKEDLLIKLEDLFDRHSIRLDRLKEWGDISVLESRVLNELEVIIIELKEEIENE